MSVKSIFLNICGCSCTHCTNTNEGPVLDEYILRLLHPTNAAGAGQAERAYAKLAY